MTRIGTIACAALLAVALTPPLDAQQPPWVTAELRGSHDNQPLDALRARAEYGGFLVPSATLAAHVIGERRNSDATVELGATATVGLAGGRVVVAATGSGLMGAPGQGLTALGDGRIGVGLGADVSLRARLTRDRYTATLASLDTLVIAHTVEVALDRAAAPGWAGELVGRREGYGAGAPVITAYGWLLAPLSRGAGHSLRAGYSAAWQDSEESNWVPDPTAGGQGGAPVPGSVIPGRYAPFYTPHDLLAHSVLGNVAVEIGAGWLILDAAYGVYARELAATLFRGSTGEVQLQFAERTFHPYRAAARWVMALGPLTSLELDAEHDRSAFYHQTVLSVSLARSLPGG